MLSSSHQAFHARQRQHRRQNSTPSAFDGVDVSQLPNANAHANARRNAAAHRRGQSLDNRRQQATPRGTRQEYNKTLREAQQQRTQARPGPHPVQYVSATSQEDQGFLISPHTTPHAQRFSSSGFDGMPVPFNWQHQMSLMMMQQKNQESYMNNMADNKSFGLYSHDSSVPSPVFMNLGDNHPGLAWYPGETASSRSSRRISDGIMDRVSKYENMGMEEAQRPSTPPNQNANNYCPPTPMETPHDRSSKQDIRFQRFSEGYDESMEATIRPGRATRAGQGIQSSPFAEMRRQAEERAAVPSPPRTNKIPNVETFHNLQRQDSNFMSMNALRNEFVKMEDSRDAPQCESDAAQIASRSQHVPNCNGGALGGRPDLQSLSRSNSRASSKKSFSHHRRTESVASIASAASIADINIEETRTETGVTLADISQFISTPETTDGKWTCLFDDCGKKFGRKENIKSHVQTHLNDRQYQCPKCQKCFVRQHDLKRHAKIHTGVKPYPCECGNSFARHDALTRHKQRGMCIGAFDGVVRRNVKRGRPRKNRPDMETRMEKSARTRKKNMSISSVSSMSAYSESSAADSPGDDFNMVDEDFEINMDTIPYKVQEPTAMSMSTAPMSTAPMPNVPPRDVIGHVTPSPSVDSVHSFVSPSDMMRSGTSGAASPSKSVASHCDVSPDDVPQASPRLQAQFFALQQSISCASVGMPVMDPDEGTINPSVMDGTLPIAAMGEQDDLMLQFSQGTEYIQLDGDPNMLMLNDGFDNDDADIFNDTDDMFVEGS